MVIVTGVEPERRTPGWVVVALDGARFATLPVEVAAELGLRAGLALSSEAVAQLSRTANAEAACRVAIRLLAARPRARQDLVRRLRERGHDPVAAAAAVARLEAQGLLDDAIFARHFIRVRAARGHGPLRLRADLLALGVEGRLVDAAISDVTEAEGLDPAAQATHLAAKRSAQLGAMPVQRKRRRLIAYLARRGFGGRDVRELVARLVP